MVYFCGKKKQLRELMKYLMRRYGRDARVADMPLVVCR